MKWWTRDDWQERLMIAVGCFLTFVGVGESIFGASGLERWLMLPLGVLILILSIVLFRRRRVRDRTAHNELDRS